MSNVTSSEEASLQKITNVVNGIDVSSNVPIVDKQSLVDLRISFPALATVYYYFEKYPQVLSMLGLTFERGTIMYQGNPVMFEMDGDYHKVSDFWKLNHI